MSTTDPLESVRESHRVYKAFLEAKEKFGNVLEIKRPESPKNVVTDWRRRSLDPEEFLLSEAQYDKYWAWMTGGWRGLIKTIELQCQQHQASSASNSGESDRHRHILDDSTRQRPSMPVILASIPPQAIRGMLMGSIIGQAYKEPEIATMVEDQLKPGHHPCIYLGEVVNRRVVHGNHHPYPGRGLNWHEWVKVIQTMRDYMAAYDANAATTLSREVDAMSTKHDTEDFRFITNKTIRAKVEIFVNQCQAFYIEPGEAVAKQNPQDPRLDVSFRRIPLEVGWAVDGLSRIGQHLGGSKSNKLFMLYKAVLWREFGRERFETIWHSVCKVADPQMAQTAEYLCSEIAGACWYQGGLNPELAGTIKMNSSTATKTGAEQAITHPKYAKDFEESARWLTHPSEMVHNIDEEREADGDRVAKIAYMQSNPRDQVWKSFEEQQLKLRDRFESNMKQSEDIFTDDLTRTLQKLLHKE